MQSTDSQLQTPLALTLLRMGRKPGAMVAGTPDMQPLSPPPPPLPASERPRLQCRCCGSKMLIVHRRIAPQASNNAVPEPAGAATRGTHGLSRQRKELPLNANMPKGMVAALIPK